MVASKGSRRQAYCSMAKAKEENKFPEEGDIQDPSDLYPLVLSEHETVHNENAQIVVYEDNVILDSGASDCMVPNFDYLDYIQAAHASVLIADGSLHQCDFQGLMRIQATDILTNKRHVNRETCQCKAANKLCNVSAKMVA